jgi:hypothetical protein
MKCLLSRASISRSHARSSRRLEACISACASSAKRWLSAENLREGFFDGRRIVGGAGKLQFSIVVDLTQLDIFVSAIQSRNIGRAAWLYLRRRPCFNKVAGIFSSAEKMQAILLLVKSS